MKAFSPGSGFTDGASVERWVAEAIGHTPFDHCAVSPEEPWTKIIALWDRHDDHLHSSPGPLCVPGISPQMRRVDLVTGFRRKVGPRLGIFPSQLMWVRFPSGLTLGVENWAVAHHRECDEPTCILIWHRAGRSEDLWRVSVEQGTLFDHESTAVEVNELPDSPLVDLWWNDVLIPVEQVTAEQCRESQDWWSRMREGPAGPP